MNPIAGLAALRKPFNWKFGYPRFNKKIKPQQFVEKCEETSWEDTFSAESVLGDHLVSPLRDVDVHWDFRAEQDYFSTSSDADSPVYANCEPPVYENVKDDDPVYERVRRLVFIPAGIYEVPRGALRPTTVNQDEEQTYEEPPGSAYGDAIQEYERLTWGRSAYEDLNNNELQVAEAIYSTVVKPRRRKKRTPISVMLQVCGNNNTGVTGINGTPWNAENSRTPEDDAPCYANCLPNAEPEEDDRPTKETTENSPTPSQSTAPLPTENLGAMIMKQYEEDRKRVRESLQLPEVSLLDVDASIEDIERERREIIGNQAVKARRITSWIKDGQAGTAEEDMIEECLLPEEADDGGTTKCIDSWVETGANPHRGPQPEEDIVLRNDEDVNLADGEVVYDSILLKKQETKRYWEQLMMAARSREMEPPISPPVVLPHPHAQQEFKDNNSPLTLSFENQPPLDSALTSSPKVVDSVGKKGESVVERDIRLQRMREQQVAIEREAAAAAAAAVAIPTSNPISTQAPSPPLTDDGFASIPTTDEGNFSEYGSEEKELLSLDGNASSRVTSPEIGGTPVRVHQRTQSLDSTSSGHSSGSGSGSGTGSGSGVIRQTPIEREIKETRSREEELAREKALRLNNEQRQFSSPNFSNGTPLKRASSTSQLLDDPLPKAQFSTSTISRKHGVLSNLVTPPITPINGGDSRRFTPNPGQKGLMQRFLASRGKLSSPGMLNTPPGSPTSPTIIPLSPAAIDKMAAVMDTPTAPADRPDGVPVRRGYISAEDKIQEELKEMRRREEELRMQRARTLARSQPNLLNLMDDCNGVSSPPMSNEVVVDKLPNTATLRSALSNPNLLDDSNGDTNEKPLQRNGGVRKRNALIEQWENRIQQQN